MDHMNIKNILIAIGVIGIGLILYKLLFGLVLPIALFVSLGYVLKFLLRGSDSDGGEDISQILTNSMTTDSTKNIVEIKPIEEEVNPVEASKPVEEDQPEEEKDKPLEKDKTFEVFNID